MARCMKNFNSKITNLKLFMIFCNMSRETGYCLWSVNDRSICGFGKVKMSTNEISMKMRFKDVFDLCLSFIGKRDVLFNITERVNYSSFTIALHIIGSFTKAAGI